MDFMKWANPDPSFYQGLYNLLKRNLARVQAEGLDYLRAELNFYNSRDYRLETALNMLERWGSIEMDEGGRQKRGPKNDKLEHDEAHDRHAATGRSGLGVRVVGELPEVAFDHAAFKTRLEKAQRRLHRMSEWTHVESCRALAIYEYFDYTEAKPCGICDNCAKNLVGAKK